MPPLKSASVLALDLGHVGFAACLILICGGISVWLRLGLSRTLLFASVRTVSQLLLVGYILRWVFGLDNAIILFALLLVMIALSAHAAVDRAGRRYTGMLLDSFTTLALSGLVMTFTATSLIIRVHPWYRPQYVVPLMGMVLGSTLTGVSLTLDTLLDELAERRNLVEMELCHGATRWEAARSPIAHAVRRSMIPTLNSMMVVGVVSLPGMMTGQVLSGVDPLLAVRYQIVIMFLLTAANTVASVLIALLAYRRLFNNRYQLRIERLRRK